MSNGSRFTEAVESTTVTWLTPKYITDDLGPFDLDPCAAPEPRPWPTATEHYALPRDNGLELPWKGRVWCNPPYGRETWGWLDRLATHNNGIALVFARTETKGFHEQVWQRARSILFIYGRLYFCRPDGVRSNTNANAPSCLVAYGRNNSRSLYESSIDGKFVKL
jgi:hypothetical protein